MLEPLQIGHLPFVRSLVREAAAAGSFDRELATTSPAASLFFTNLGEALRTGYFIQYDPLAGRVRPLHVTGYAYRVAEAKVPVGFALLKEFRAGCFELWLAAVSPVYRRQGHGRRMIAALLATPVGQLTQVVRCNRGTPTSEAAAKLFAHFGFVVRRATATQWWLVQKRAPQDLVASIATAAVVRVAGT